MPGVIKSYIHTRNQIGALVKLNCQNKVTAMTSEFQTLAQEIAMQVAACPRVRYVRSSEIPDRVIRQIEQKLALETQPFETLQQYLRSISLYDQFYLRDNSITIEDLIKLRMTQLSENITVNRFVRFAIEDSNDSNPPSDPSSGVPIDPVPNSPTPLASEAEIDAWDINVWDDDSNPVQFSN